MQKTDLAIAVELERQANLVTFDVPGIGECQALEPFAWRDADYLAAIRQYRSRRRGMFDTRAYVGVTVMPLLDEQSGTQVEAEIITGSLVYEIQDDGLEILRVSAGPADDATRQAFTNHLVETCARSKKRHRLRCYISDGDWANLRFFVRLGWDRRLLPSFFPDNRDAWLVQHDVVGAPPRRDLAGA